MAEIHCDESITERTAFPVLRLQVEYINSFHFHIIQSSWNSKYLHIFHREKNAIMHFLRLLLFFFVLLAPLQLTTADQCTLLASRGGSVEAAEINASRPLAGAAYGSLHPMAANSFAVLPEVLLNLILYSLVYKRSTFFGK